MMPRGNLEGNCAIGHLVDLRIQIDTLTGRMVVTGDIVGSYFLTRIVMAGRGDHSTHSLKIC